MKDANMGKTNSFVHGESLEIRLIIMKDANMGKTNSFVHGESLEIRLHNYSQLESWIAPKV